jgi:H+/gluconate symporter-like permease
MYGYGNDPTYNLVVIILGICVGLLLMIFYGYLFNYYIIKELREMNRNIKDLKDPGEQKYMSPKEFVNIFPNKVIKNGNVLNIKEDMEKVLGIKSSSKNNLIKRMRKRKLILICMILKIRRLNRKIYIN